MAPIAEDMQDLDDRDRDVLAVLVDGRANPYLIREQTGLDRGDANTVLVRLCRWGHVEQVTRGLYEITAKGKNELDVDDDVANACQHLQRARANESWTAVEDAMSVLGCDQDE